MSNHRHILNQDADTVAECFSAHYTNIFLIHLYDQARKYAGTTANIPNVTEGYKTAIAAYNNAMSKADFVSVTITGIYHQFLKLDKTMRRGECINRILTAFFPEDGYQGIVKQEKFIERAISKIIHDVTKLIICSVPVNHIKSIIDHNEDPKTVLSIQNDFRDITIELMERNHIDYLNKKKAQYHNPDTNYSMFEKAKGELAKVNSEKAELEAKLNIMQKGMQDMQIRNNDLNEKIGNQTSRIKELESQIQVLKSQSGGLIQTGQLAPQYSVYQPPQQPQSQPTYQPPAHQANQPQPSGGDSSNEVSKPRRDYSHILNDVNSDSDEDEVEALQPAKKVETRQSFLNIDDDSEVSLNMFSK